MMPWIAAMPDGQIVGAGFAQDAQHVPPATIGKIVLGVTATPGIEYFDWHNEKACRMPSRPSKIHAFNYVTRLWELDREAAWKAVRLERDLRLSRSDWTVLSDVPLSDWMKSQWTSYRQQLRDITLQSDPSSIQWPVPPQ